MSWKDVMKLINKMNKQQEKNEKLLEKAKEDVKNFK